MSNTLAIVLGAVGFRRATLNRFLREADELTATARALRVQLEAYKRAPDPFGALLSDMHNNHEFIKFLR